VPTTWAGVDRQVSSVAMTRSGQSYVVSVLPGHSLLRLNEEGRSMSEGCVFCDQSWMRAAEIFIETPHCLFASTRDPDIRAGAGLAEGVLPGSGAIVPIAHRTSVFELTPAEWADTQDLLLRARMALHDLLAPDGYLLGWNQGGVLHPHMHVIPRFDDEPLADRWLRSAINVPENRRPDPWAPGSGRGLRGAR
jgi:diadenosine tetraphosphate (Ap4A) HIT family hydrolase